MLTCSIMSFSRYCYASSGVLLCFFPFLFSAHTSLPHSLRRLIPHHTPLSNPLPFYPPPPLGVAPSRQPNPIIPQHPSIPPPDFPFPHHQITSRLSSKTKGHLAVVGGFGDVFAFWEGGWEWFCQSNGKERGLGAGETYAKVSGILVGEVISSFGVVDGVSH